MLLELSGPKIWIRKMGKEIGYVDWDTVVQTAEANIEIMQGNKKRAEIGELCERLVLEQALKERAKFPKPKEKPSDKSRVKPSDEDLSQAKK